MRITLPIREYLQPRTMITTALFLIMLVSFVVQNAILQGVFILSGTGIYILYNNSLFRLTDNQKNYLVALVAVCLFTLPINVFRAPTVALHFLMVLATIAAALAVAKDRRAYAHASFIVLAFAQTAVLAFLASRGTDNFPLEEMIPDASSNGITSYLVCLQINYCIANLRVNRRMSLITAAITLYICVVGYGRGSILAATGILLVSLLFAFQFLRRDLAIIATVALGGAAAYLLLEYFPAIYAYAEANTKIGSGLFDDSRAAMNQEYLSRLQGLRILFGASYDGTLIDRFYNGNPHNSFIRAHHLFGLGYVILVVLMAARPLMARVPLTDKAFYLAMFAILIFRASTEPVLFPTPLDTLYVALFLLIGTERAAQTRTALVPQMNHRFA